MQHANNMSARSIISDILCANVCASWSILRARYPSLTELPCFLVTSSTTAVRVFRDSMLYTFLPDIVENTGKPTLQPKWRFHGLNQYPPHEVRKTFVVFFSSSYTAFRLISALNTVNGILQQHHVVYMGHNFSHLWLQVKPCNSFLRLVCVFVMLLNYKVINTKLVIRVFVVVASWTVWEAF